MSIKWWNNYIIYILLIDIYNKYYFKYKIKYINQYFFLDKTNFKYKLISNKI